MAEIFDFSIGIKAQDDATETLNKVLGTCAQMGRCVDSLGRNSTESFEAVKTGVNGFADAMEQGTERAEKAARDANGRFVKSGMDITGGLKEAATFLQDLPNMVSEGLGDATITLTSGLKVLTAQLTATDEAAISMANTFQGKVLDSAISTGVGVTDLTEMATQMASVSVHLSDLQQEEIKTLSLLGDTYGLTGQQAGELMGNLAFTGNNLRALTDDAAQFQKDFQVIGLFNHLNDAMSGVNDLFAQFGNTVVGDGTKAAKSMLKNAAAMSRAFNIDIATAIQKTQASMQHFIGELDNFEDIELGLATDFGDSTKALFELGAGIGEAKELLKLGQDDAFLFAKKIKEIAAARGFDEKSQRRMIKLVAKSSDETTKQLLLHEESFNAEAQARKERATAAGEAVTSFGLMTKAARNTISKTMKSFGNLVELGKIMVAGVFGPVFSDAFNDANGALESFNKNVMKLRNRLADESGYFQTTVAPKIRSIGSALLAVGGAISSVITTVGSFKIFTKTIGGANKVMNKFGLKFDWLGKSAKGFFGKIGGLVKKFPLITAGIELVSMFKDLGAGFKSGEASGTQFMKFMGRLGEGVVNVLDNLTFGLPSKIMQMFTGSTDSLGDAVGKWFKNAFSSFQGRSLRIIVRDFVSDTVIFISKHTSAVADALGSMFKAGFKSVSKWWNGGQGALDFGTDLLLGLASLGNIIIDSAKGIFEGLFAVSFDAFATKVGIGLKVLWANVKSSFKSGALGMEIGFIKAATFASDAFASMKKSATVAVANIGEAFATAWPKMKIGFETAVHSIMSLATRMGKGIVLTMANVIGGMAEKAKELPGIGESARTELSNAASAMVGLTTKFNVFATAENERHANRMTALNQEVEAAALPYKMAREGAQLLFDKRVKQNAAIVRMAEENRAKVLTRDQREIARIREKGEEQLGLLTMQEKKEEEVNAQAEERNKLKARGLKLDEEALKQAQKAKKDGEKKILSLKQQEYLARETLIGEKAIAKARADAKARGLNTFQVQEVTDRETKKQIKRIEAIGKGLSSAAMAGSPKVKVPAKASPSLLQSSGKPVTNAAQKLTPTTGTTASKNAAMLGQLALAVGNLAASLNKPQVVEIKLAPTRDWILKSQRQMARDRRNRGMV